MYLVMKKLIRRFLIWLALTLLLLAVGGALFLYFIYKGPSPHYRDHFVREAVENGTDGLLVRPFLGSDEIDSILNDNNG